MHFTILLPHYRTGKMSAYSIKQILEKKGRHSVNIVIIDNGNGVGTELIPKSDHITVIAYPEHLLQSHGIAFDYALSTVPELISECFITVESDSFPMDERWLDHYEDYANKGFDLAGGKLQLSGGQYIHPAGTMYRKSNWRQAIDDVRGYGYHFYESIVPPCYHLMRKSKLEDDVSDAKRVRFLPIAQSVFHQGMGFNDENVDTYGRRSMESEPPTIFPPPSPKEEYLRVMYEPGQWFAYWHKAKGKKIFEIPTEVKWMEGRENQNQEYSLMENGFKHLWGITAYSECSDPSMQRVIDFKMDQMNNLVGK